MSADGWQLSFAVSREAAAAFAADEGAFADLPDPPTLVVSEPDATQPERWQVDLYFAARPDRALLGSIAERLPGSPRPLPAPRPLSAADWVTMSQAGVEPVRAGRFRVRTPEHAPPPDAVDLVIPAGLAFGTGHHATTAGCLALLDELKRRGKRYGNVLDLGTGSGLLAFAARRLWPTARVRASDIDPVAIGVVRENMALNRLRRIDLVVADGLAERAIVAGAPYDLVIANILAAPLIAMAPAVAAAVAPRGTLLLAGLLTDQAAPVARAYRQAGMRVVASRGNSWPVLQLTSRRRG